MDTRVCNECFEHKPLDQYGFKTSAKDSGRRPKCRACVARRQQAVRAKGETHGIDPVRVTRTSEQMGISIFTPWVSTCRPELGIALPEPHRSEWQLAMAEWRAEG